MADYEKQPTRMCGHPELIPTRWEQKRPEACEMIRICDCGANQSCGVCGWGQGSFPCACSPKHSYIGDVPRYNI